MKLAMDCDPGQQGLSTTLSGTLDDKTSFYTILHIMQDNTGFTVAHSHHTVTTERGQPFSHDAKYLESSALNDLEKLGVKGMNVTFVTINLNSSQSMYQVHVNSTLETNS